MKDLNYYKNNCEEDYIKTPISVLRYITELEKKNEAEQLTLTDVGSTLTDKEKIDYEIAQKRKDKDYNIQGWGCAGITVLALIVVGYNLLKFFAS